MDTRDEGFGHFVSADLPVGAGSQRANHSPIELDLDRPFVRRRSSLETDIVASRDLNHQLSLGGWRQSPSPPNLSLSPAFGECNVGRRRPQGSLIVLASRQIEPAPVVV
jgi:hypothetical protein